MKRFNWLLLTLMAVLVLAALVVFPIGKGIISGKGIVLGLDLQGGLYLVYEADLSGIDSAKQGEIVDGVVSVISNRINPLGVTEPLIEKQGTNRIAVQLPGLAITEAQKDRLGRTALLEFRELVTDAQGKESWIPATGTIDGVAKALNSSYFNANTEVRTNDTGTIYL
jgi:preprotein translocase subunit SecD